MGQEGLLVEIGQAVEIVVADDRQDVEVVGIARFRELLGHVDAVDIVRDQARDIGAHGAVFHHGDDAGDQQHNGDGAQAQDDLELQSEFRGVPENVPHRYRPLFRAILNDKDNNYGTNPKIPAERRTKLKKSKIF